MLVPIKTTGLGQTDLASRISSSARQIAMEQVKGVYFRSQVSPDVQLTEADVRAMLQGQQRTGHPTEFFLGITKPAVYVDTSLGTIKIAPWGEPTLNLFPVLVGAGVLGFFVALALAKRVIR